MDVQDRQDFTGLVDQLAERHWGWSSQARGSEMTALWEAACAHGLFDPELAGTWELVLDATRALGRRGVPLPLAEGLLAGTIFGDALARAVGVGEVKIVAGFGDENTPAGVGDFVDSPEGATHVLAANDDGRRWSLHPLAGRSQTPGTPEPRWSRVDLGEASHEVFLDARRAAEVTEDLRLALCARALGAATRTHELATEHAKTRRQFGRPIGAFGAVQQRTATGQIAVTAGVRLIEAALEARGTEAAQRPLASRLAAEYLLTEVPRLQFDAHHTLAAVGYFDEHEGPWLFRRIQADLARARLIPSPVGGVAEALVEHAGSLPGFGVSAAARSLSRELDALIEELGAGAGEVEVEQAVGVFAERGYLSMAWPREFGGRAASVDEQMTLTEKVRYHRLPLDWQMSASALLGHAIVEHGNDEQRERFLPQIAGGRLRFCLGYSEPEAGSDLASLKTRAERDGDSWIVNGQKIWTTRGHVASHVWLAVRTDPEAERPHGGITVFLIPMDTPGIEVQQHRALSGEISCSVFFDDVRVPDSDRVGPVDGGWRVITSALASERVVMGGIAAVLHRQLDDLLEIVRGDPERTLGPPGSAARERLTRMAVQVQACRALVRWAAQSAGSGTDGRTVASMAGVLGGEVAESFSQNAIELLGPRALLAPQSPGALGDYTFEAVLRLSIMFVVGGGTNDIQRGLVARGLGLPR